MGASADQKRKSTKKALWIWSVNAFHDEPSSQWRAVEALAALRPGAGLSLQPVSCLAIGQYDPVTHTFPHSWHELAASAHQNLDKLFSRRSHEGLQAFRLLHQQTPAVTAAVDALIRFALDAGAEGIALTSHGRRGPLRLLLGSFAESLVLRSPLPVLVVNPKAAKPKHLKSIVFPTDFSQESKTAFDRTVPMAALTGAELILFHKLNRLYPEVGNAVPSGNTELNPLLVLEAHLRSVAAGWISEAKKAGVQAKIQLDFKPGRILDSLLPVVRRQGNDTVVAMASTSGPVRAMLVGNLPRQVLRQCRQPVLIFHAEQESLSRRFLNQTTQLAFAFGANPPIR